MPHVDDPLLLAAVRSGDPAATDRFTDLYTPLLRATLRKKFPYMPPEEIADAANDTLLDFLIKPESYQPERGAGVLTFLTLIATRNVLDKLRKAERQRKREFAVGGLVELELWSANNQQEAASSEAMGDNPDALSAEIEQWLADVIPDPLDRRMLDLIMDGRTNVAQGAALIGIAPDEWKQRRDRIKAVLEATARGVSEIIPMRINEEARNRRYRAQLVRRAIDTLATDAPLLAPRLAWYARAEGLTWNQLAESLGTDADSLNHVALCRPPRPDTFVSDVEAIARQYVAPERLLPLLRRLQVLETFAAAAAESGGNYRAGADDTGGVLLAARDREEDAPRTPDAPQADTASATVASNPEAAPPSRPEDDHA